jgi:hypothetical protein
MTSPDSRAKTPSIGATALTYPFSDPLDASLHRYRGKAGVPRVVSTKTLCVSALLRHTGSPRQGMRAYRVTAVEGTDEYDFIFTWFGGSLNGSVSFPSS